MIFLYILLGIVYCIITCLVFVVEMFDQRNDDGVVLLLAKAVFWPIYGVLFALGRVFKIRRYR